MALWPEHDQLLEAVTNAGWLLEHHALRVLDAAEMHPRSGWAYQDPDEPTTSRELDVWSYRQLMRDDKSKVFVTARFLVECKQSSLPYVGIGHDLPEWRFGNPTQHALPREQVGVPTDRPNVTRSVPAWDHYGFRDLARENGDSTFRMTQLTRLDRKGGGDWEARNTGIFTSLVYPLAKALRASQKDINRHGPASSFPGAHDRVTWLDFALHFPLVLVSCPLYVVDATNPEPTVRQVPWATAVRQLKSKNVEGTFEFDIVTEPAFAEYVATRLAFARALAALVETDPLHFTGENRPPR